MKILKENYELSSKLEDRIFDLAVKWLMKKDEKFVAEDGLIFALEYLDEMGNIYIDPTRDQYDDLIQRINNRIKNMRRIKENSVSRNLPEAVDEMLQGVAQYTGKFDYNDIIKFSKVVTDKDIKILTKYAREFDKIADDNGTVDDSEFDAVADIVLRSIDSDKRLSESSDTNSWKDLKDWIKLDEERVLSEVYKVLIRNGVDMWDLQSLRDFVDSLPRR